MATINQRISALTRLVLYPETSFGSDPGAPVGYVVPLAAQSGFRTNRNILPVPNYIGNRLTNAVVRGSATAAGAVPVNLEFELAARIGKLLFGDDGYSRPGGGTTTLHRLRIPTTTGAAPGSCQLQAEALQTTAQYLRAKGVRVGGMSFAYATEGPATYNVDFQGIGDEVQTDLAGTKNAISIPGVSYFNGRAVMNGFSLVGMTGFSMNIAAELMRQDVAFNDGIAAAINQGKINVSGNIALAMAIGGSTPESEMTYYNYAVNETEVPVECMWADKPIAQATQWMRVIMPAVRFSQASWVPGGDGGIIVDQQFMVPLSTNSKTQGETFGTILGPYNIGATTNIFAAKIDGVAKNVTLTQGAARTAAQVVSDLNADVPFNTVAVAEVIAGRVFIRTKTKGSGGSAQFDTGVANHCGVALGFDNTVYTGLDDCPILIEFYNTINTNL